MEVLYPSPASVEVNGIPVKGFRSLQVTAEKTLHEVKCFGEGRPAAFVEQGTRYRITCGRLCLSGEDFGRLHKLSGFSVTVKYAGKKTVYTGCEWLSIRESALGEPGVAEEAVLLALKRTEELQNE